MTKRIAVVGANGQVGSEVCLLARREPGLFIVPICRNRLGSAFLRSQGVRCRHGLVADPHETPRLIGDCEVIANFALAGGRPKDAAQRNTAVIEASTRLSPPGATIVYFSTQNVYGDASPGARLRWRNLYGREKLRCERLSERLARVEGKRLFVFRLGHVTGELQTITADIRDRIRSGAVPMPRGGGRLSNTTHVVTIVEALTKVLAGVEPPGVYDLMSSPQWTWREVYEYEAEKLCLELTIEPIPSASEGRRGEALALGKDAGRRIVRAVQRSAGLKEAGRIALAFLHERHGERSQAAFWRSRAAGEIAALTTRESPHDALDWEPNGKAFLPSLTPTIDLLRAGKGSIPAGLPTDPFPPDLPDATVSRKHPD